MVFSAAVVIGFFVCWAPFHAQRLLYMHARESEYYEEINAWMFFITGILYYFSSTLNPILYNIMSNRYRIAFKEIFCGVRMENHSLTRNSTFRETRQISHSDSQRNIEQTTPTHQTFATLCNVTENGNNTTVHCCNHNLLAVKNPSTGNTIIYQFANSGRMPDITCLNASRETCI